MVDTHLVKRLLLLAAISIIILLIEEVVTPRLKQKESNVYKHYPPGTKLRIAIFSSKALWDIYIIYFVMWILNIYKYIPSNWTAEDTMQWVFIITVLFLTINIFIRFTINHLRSENGKPDILDHYLKEDKNEY